MDISVPYLNKSFAEAFLIQIRLRPRARASLEMNELQMRYTYVARKWRTRLLDVSEEKSKRRL